MLSFTQARPYNKSLPQSCFLQFLLESTVAFGTFQSFEPGATSFTQDQLDLHARTKGSRSSPPKGAHRGHPFLAFFLNLDLINGFLPSVFTLRGNSGRLTLCWSRNTK
jgi:hypothetical protein